VDLPTILKKRYKSSHEKILWNIGKDGSPPTKKMLDRHEKMRVPILQIKLCARPSCNQNYH